MIKSIQKIFISYSHDDKHWTYEFAEAIKLELNYSVFVDYLSIPIGTKWWRNICENIESADCIIYVMTSKSIESIYCSAEIDYAISLNKPILPIMLKTCDFPSKLSQIHYLLMLDNMQIRDTLPKLQKGLHEVERLLSRGEYNIPDPLPSRPDVPNADDTKSAEELAQKIIISPRKIIKPGPSIHIMPQPFTWIDIPAGKTSISNSLKRGYLKEDTIFDVPEFQIAKYPVTNAQYRLFLDTGGYQNDIWWTKAGLKARDAGKQWKTQSYKPTDEAWIQPVNWDTDSLNDEDPVSGVSWYEAIAYCRWLSEVSGENIILPTEQQWQRAAQGDDEREYPWGKEWVKNRCNNAKFERIGIERIIKGKNGKTSVQKFEGIGDSPFRVVDMAGNLWEWCLTHHQNGNISGDKIVNGACIIRGGAWGSPVGVVTVRQRSKANPTNRDITYGFRLARLGVL